MNDAPELLKPARLPSFGQSPSRQRAAADDILAHLAPATAADALASATGPLRDCLEGASAAERDFAMRTALAARKIWEWVGELGDWSWPSEGGPAGFEMPGGKRRKLSIQLTSPEEDNDQYVGSLLSEDVVRYERRIDDIHYDMNGLAVEEIKSHVMTNHIMPLSRPTTPMSDSNRSGLSSIGSYNKMEDLTAVITAIVVQTLPLLAKLSRLLQIWSIRLSVLQQISPLLRAIEDAEVALKSGWNAITVRPKDSDTSEDDSALHAPQLVQSDFDVMKKVLEKKVSKPGRSLDYMLDSLEGQQDTLPEQWLDRMEAVERDYGDWVAACDRRVRETEWTKATISHKPEGLHVREETEDTEPAEVDTSRSNGSPAAKLRGQAMAFPVPQESDDVEEPSKEKRDTRADILVDASHDGTQHEESFIDNPEQGPETVDWAGVDGTRDTEPASAHVQPPAPPAQQTHQPDMYVDERPRWDPEDNICSPHDEVQGEPELPPLRNESRRLSDASQTSTVVYGASSRFGHMSSDPPEVSASPDISRTRIREAEYVRASPPSSPPMPAQGRELSAAPPDSPRLQLPEDEDSFYERQELDDSLQDEYDDSFSLSELTRPVERRDSVGDKQLRQQLSQIIESIPAKIKLTNEPPPINLNPPDLQLPRIKKRPSREGFRRSTSAMSSRTATPSFTLSPAKNTRIRHQRGQQEIKVYHLSRSNGEAPIKLFIRCVGEHGERVMVRVGGGWADLSEYLKEYASHHGRRSAGTEKAKVEVQDLPRVASGRGPGAAANSSPPSRPASALDLAPSTPLNVRKTRRSMGASGSEAPQLQPKTPVDAARQLDNIPSSEGSARSRSSSHLSWVEEDSSFLGLAGPSGKRVEMSEENKAWVESIKEKVRLASGERKVSGPAEDNKRFGEMDRIGGTKRLFRKGDAAKDAKK